MKATEREAGETAAAARRVDTGVIEGEVERVSSRAGVTSPVAATVAGVVQGAIRIDIPATDKEQWTTG